MEPHYINTESGSVFYSRADRNDDEENGHDSQDEDPDYEVGNEDGTDDNNDNGNDGDEVDDEENDENSHYENEENQDDEYEDDEGADLEVELIMQPPNGNTGATRTARLSARQIIALFQGGDLHDIFMGDDGEGFSWNRPRRRSPPDPNRFPEVPSTKGAELMHSGSFGTTSSRLRLSSSKRLARLLLEREISLGDYSLRHANEGLMAQSLIPSKDPDMIINYDEPAYSGQFSTDGNFFFACVKDFQIRMYDTSNPYNWKHYKTVHYPGSAHWTLTDASLSPDNMWLAYTSLCPDVALAPTDPKDHGEPYFLNLGSTGGRSYRNFRIFSIRFSGDGRELVAGTSNGGLTVYDIESRTTRHYVKGHEDDVNAVCFADVTSPHVLYSGSDDSTIKVWDRRSMSGARPAGIFVGHIEGLTYLDSKGDGRYILSNGKDQSMKLWDLRMAMSSEQFAEKHPTRYASQSTFDYRWGRYDEDDWFPHPDDNSVVTFRGHRVLQTLIRCHFSPPGSTDSRYVYTGSHDGKIYIYNLDATLAGTVDVKKATYDTRPKFPGRTGRWETCVRDASWHPHAPMIVASSLNGWDQEYGTCSVHSYNESPEDDGEHPKMGVRVDDKLNPSPFFHLKTEPGYGRFRRWH